MIDQRQAQLERVRHAHRIAIGEQVARQERAKIGLLHGIERLLARSLAIERRDRARRR